MSWCTINGVPVAGVVSLPNPPAGTRRDIGNQSNASDGSLVVTRQTRKFDLKVTTIPLSGDDAQAWEGLFVGEGHTFAFDALALYSSKGLGPSSSTAATITSTTPSPKFGASNLRLAATTGTITWAAVINSSGSSSAWTVCVWRFESAAWHHYIVRSDGAKWYDGVRNDAVVTTWLTVSSANVTVANTSGSAVNYDDLVVLPYKVPDAWPPILGVATSAFQGQPYIAAAGDLVREAATRRMACKSVSEKVMIGNAGAGLQRDLRTLEVELAGA